MCGTAQNTAAALGGASGALGGVLTAVVVVQVFIAAQRLDARPTTARG